MTGIAQLRGGLPLILAGILLSGPYASANPLMESSAFQSMQQTGFSHASALEFADFAERRNDPDAAIAALEHSLLQNGENDDLHARLADLYTRIGNIGMAQHHASYSEPSKVTPERRVWGKALNRFAIFGERSRV